MSVKKRGFKFFFKEGDPPYEPADVPNERFQPVCTKDAVTIRIPSSGNSGIFKSRQKRHTRTKSVTIRFTPCHDDLNLCSQPKTTEVPPCPCKADESAIGDSEDFSTADSGKSVSKNDAEQHTQCPLSQKSDVATYFTNLQDFETQTPPLGSRANSECSGTSTIYHDMAETVIVTPSESTPPENSTPLASSEFVPCKDTDTEEEKIFEETRILPPPPLPVKPPKKTCGCYGSRLPKDATESLEYLPNKKEEPPFNKLQFTAPAGEFLLRENSSSLKNIAGSTSIEAIPQEPKQQLHTIEETETSPDSSTSSNTSGALLRDAIMAECCVCSDKCLGGPEDNCPLRNAEALLQPCLKHSDFTESLNYRLRKAIHYDTKIVCGGREYACHGIALQAYSKYFDRLRRPKESIHRIELPPDVIGPEDFPIVMDWILLDDHTKYNVITRANVLSLYAAACCLQIPGLVQQCVHFINERLQENNEKNLMQLYTEACRKPHCNALRKPIAAKLIVNFITVYQNCTFLDLGADELITLIEADDVQINSELQIFDSAIRWLLHDWPKRRPHTIRILKCVRFGLMTPLELTQLQHREPFQHVLAEPGVKAMVDEGLAYAIYHDHYKTRPQDFLKWLKCSKVSEPRPRTNIQPSGQHPPPPSCPQETETSDNLYYDTTSPKERVISQEDQVQTPSYPKRSLPALIKAQALFRGHLARKRYEDLRNTSNWVQKTYGIRAAPPGGRASTSSANTPSLLLPGQENLLVLGGMNPKKPFDLHNNNSQNIYRYNFKENLWRLKGRLPSPRSHAGVVHLQGLVYLFGGHDPTKSKSNPCTLHALSSCISLDPTTGTWRHDLPSLHHPRTNFSWTCFNNRIYVFGGKNNTGALSSCELYDPSQGSWTLITPLPEPCLSSTAVNVGPFIYIIGGITFHRTHKDQISKHVWVYNPTSDSWSQGPSMDHGRCFAQSVTHFSKIYIIGGVGRPSKAPKGGSRLTPTTSLGEIAELNLRTMRWTQTDRLKVPRHGHSVAKLGNHVVTIGGASSKTMQPLDSVELYNLDSKGSSRLLAPLPQPLNGMAVIKI